MAVEKIYTPSELNRFAKDAEEKVRNVKGGYPVHISPNDGRTGAPVVSILRLKKVGEDKIINHKFSAEVKEMKDGKEVVKNEDIFVFKARMATYEYIDPETGETRRIDLPDFPKVSLPELYNFSADMAATSEAFRKLTIMQTMANPQVVATGLPGTGIPLADRLSGTAGISYVVEGVLREEFKRKGYTGSVNAYIDAHESQRVITELKDKYWTALVNQYVAACRTIGKAVGDVSKVQMINLASTGVAPTVVAAPKINVTETSDMVKPRSDSFGNSDLFKSEINPIQFK